MYMLWQMDRATLYDISHLIICTKIAFESLQKRQKTSLNIIGNAVFDRI